MTTSLEVKKIGFVEGSIVKPSENDLYFKIVSLQQYDQVLALE